MLICTYHPLKADDVLFKGGSIMFGEAYALGTSPGGPAAQGSPTLSFFVPLIIIFFIFYILIWLPQKKDKKKLEEMRSGLKKGDKVVTSAGIHGIVANVKENIITVKVDDNVKINFSRSPISKVIKS